MNRRTLLAAFAAIALVGNPAQAADAPKDIVDTAVAAGSFKTLAKALTAAEGGALRIELEGHGREEIADDIDISRTVGWFTTLYPVTLEIPAGASASDRRRGSGHSHRGKIKGNGAPEMVRGGPRRDIGALSPPWTSPRSRTDGALWM